MKRKQVDELKSEIKRLLKRIDTMERVAGWKRYEKQHDGLYENAATNKPHPEDVFEYGQYVAAVKRACIDVQKACVEVRK